MAGVPAPLDRQPDEVARIDRKLARLVARASTRIVWSDR